jgi:hypothetical protein
VLRDDFEGGLATTRPEPAIDPVPEQLAIEHIRERSARIEIWLLDACGSRYANVCWSVWGAQKSRAPQFFDHAAWATALTSLSASFVKASSVFFSSASV